MLQLGNITMYTPEDVCLKLHIGRSKCYKLFKSKELRAVRLGKRLLVSEDNLKAFLNSGKKI